MAVVLIQCGAVSQVIPVETACEGLMDERNDWAAHFVDLGRAAGPISSHLTRVSPIYDQYCFFY
jgi:hypothetical protein